MVKSKNALLKKLYSEHFVTLGGGWFVLDPMTSSWNVRGIISASLVDLDYGCDVNKFTLYTNVARFTTWINKTIEATQEVSYRFIDYKCEVYDNR